VKHAPEIQGYINSNYLSLEEFVILFFLRKYQLRRLVEMKVIEFLSSLKYYSRIWPRAKTMAQLLGIIHFGESSNTDANVHSCDIYMQEFFFFVYSQIMKSKDALVEHNEEQTFILSEKEPMITAACLFWQG